MHMWFACDGFDWLVSMLVEKQLLGLLDERHRFVLFYFVFDDVMLLNTLFSVIA